MTIDGRPPRRMGATRAWPVTLRLFACMFGLTAAVAVGAGQEAVQTEVTNFHQFFELTQKEAGKPVRFKGIVLCYDAGWGQLYINDGSETKWFSPASFPMPLEPGQSVEITGAVTFADADPGLTNLHLTILGRQALPQAKRHKLDDLAGDVGEWVETTGRVRVAEASSGRLTLVIESEGRSGLVHVMGEPGGNNFKRLVGSLVRIRGINASKVVTNKLESAWLFAPGSNEVKILEAATTKPANIEVLSIDALLSRELGDWTNTMVHVNGLVLDYKPGDYIEVKDPTGIIRAQVIQTSEVQRDERVDLWGFLSLSGNEPQLRDASFEVLRASAPNLAAPIPETAAGTTNLDKVLTQASDIMKLPREAAARHLPVRLTGVITYADSQWNTAFFHDASGGIYMDLNQSNIHAGQWVQITGRTSVGGFAPEVADSKIEVLGTTNLPTPAQVDLEDLINGHLDAHWVEMEGVVRRVNVASGHVELTLITRKGRFKVIIPDFNDQPPPVQLIDALVSVQGACGSEMNARGQLSGITLHVPGFEQVKILEPVPQDPFAARTMPIGSVATFDAKQLVSRRVKLSGVVTLILPGQGFFLQDTSGGIRANTQQTLDLHIGDTVDVLGFPAMGDFSPCLEEASFRKTGTGPLPEPMKTTAEEILGQGRHDALVVQLQAQLVQSVVRSAQQKLLLQNGPIIFTAHLEGLRPGQELPALQSGSFLRLTGVCSIQGGEGHEPSAFRLLVSSPNEVKLVKSPPWWSLRHTMTLAGILTLGIIIAFAWVRSLRRQVRAQTELIQQKHKELLEISRRAGMAEVATGVLHNVGNVLNSVNITTCLMADKFKKSKLDNLSKVVALMREHEADLGAFITTDPKGKELTNYLDKLAEHLGRERKEFLEESGQLQKNVDHIKDIVAMQQSYAKACGVSEVIPVTDLVEDALRMNASSLERHDLRIIRDYPRHAPEISVEKHKALQILVNLIRNAKHACDDSNRLDKQLTIQITNGDGRVKITLSDNGVGIPQENLTRIFSHGFTTRKDGHGFGLHSGALAAKEMGGTLLAHSEGKDKGASFILELPLLAAGLN